MNRQVKIGIIISIILLLVVGFVFYSKKSDENKFVSQIERNITAENRKIFEDRILADQNKLTEAKSDGEKYNLYLSLGYNEYALGDLQAAKGYFNEALKIDADQYDVYLGLFLTEVDMQDLKSAESSIKKSINIRKGIADLWKKYIQFKIDRLNASNDEVNSLYQNAIEDVKNNGDVSNLIDIYTAYASWLEKAGNLSAAVNYWKKAIEVNPDKKTVYEAEINRLNKLIEQQTP